MRARNVVQQLKQSPGNPVTGVSVGFRALALLEVMKNKIIPQLQKQDMQLSTKISDAITECCGTQIHRHACPRHLETHRKTRLPRLSASSPFSREIMFLSL